MEEENRARFYVNKYQQEEDIQETYNRWSSKTEGNGFFPSAKKQQEHAVVQ